MSFFTSTPAKILYVILLGAVIFAAAQQKMHRAGVQPLPATSEPTGLAPRGELTTLRTFLAVLVPGHDEKSSQGSKAGITLQPTPSN